MPRLEHHLKEGDFAVSRVAVIFALLICIFGAVFLQTASATVYNPGETLEPDCAPGSSNCGVAAYPSFLGTTTPITNSLLTIQATSTNSILATLRAFVGQVANLFQVQDSTGSNIFSINSSGGLTLASPIGVLYGGTGIASSPAYGNLLVGNSLGGFALTATSSLGLGGGGGSGTVTSVGLTVPVGLTVIGSPITTSGTLALSLSPGYILPLTASTTEYDTAYSNRITSVSSPLSITNHALSLSTSGGWAGTFDGQEGVYYLDARNLSNFGTPFFSYFSATTTDALPQGSLNKYYSDGLVNSFIHSSSTIPKTYSANIFIGSNTFSGGLTLGTFNGPLQANGGLVSATTSVGVLYGGTGLTSTPSFGQILRGTGTGYALVATSTLGVDLSDTLGTLVVVRGGTGATSFNQGWVFSFGNGNALSASTSPTVNYITATSTTATSTFANGINITGGCFAKNGVCVGGGGSDLQSATSFMNTNVALSTGATSTLTTVNVTPSAATGDVFVQAEVSIRSASNTDGTAVIAIRKTGCTGTVLAQMSEVITEGNAVGASSLFLTAVDVDAGASSQVYALCGSAVTQGHTATVYSLSAMVIDTGSDVAELYTTNDASLEAGDVVSFDSTLKSGVKKSAKSDDKNVLGIVSTKPGNVIGGVGNEGVKAVPVALSGRVPMKVIVENGAIEAGDYLTPSSIPGAAMKASGEASVIGQAMSAYGGEGVGIVLVFVKNFHLNDESVLLGDVSPGANKDGLDNGLSTLVATIQSEGMHDPIALISEKITDGKQFLTDFVAARVTAIRGYFDEVFARKIHTEQICVKKSSGGETCVDGDQLDSLLQNTNIPEEPDPPAIAEPADITVSGSSSTPPTMTEATSTIVTP
jgi:hypothetical protein